MAAIRALVNPTKASLRSEVDLCVSTLSTYILLHKRGWADVWRGQFLEPCLQQVTASPAALGQPEGPHSRQASLIRHSRFALEAMLATVAVQVQFWTVLVNADLQLPVNHCSHLQRKRIVALPAEGL